VFGPDTKLTVTHSILDEASVMHQDVTQGWQAVISNRKTTLETAKLRYSQAMNGSKNSLNIRMIKKNIFLYQ